MREPTHTHGRIIPFGRKEDRRLDKMIQIADETDLPLDHIVNYMGRCSEATFKAFSDNPSLLPLYTKSKVRP